MDELCFWCLGEMCTHKPPDDSKFIHPSQQHQVKAVTAFQGTPCCAACALDIAKILARLTGPGLERVGASLALPVMPASMVTPT